MAWALTKRHRSRPISPTPPHPGRSLRRGHFGPWEIEDPSQTPLSANYSFQNADLGVFHGIAGILASKGKFGGILENIDVQGQTVTPDFTISIAGHPLLLKTDFQATVDGTNGNTLLHPVIAQFLHMTLVCNGGVVKPEKGPGREIVPTSPRTTPRWRTCFVWQ